MINYIYNLLEKGIYQDINFNPNYDISYLKDTINKISQSKKYYYDFILTCDENFILSLIPDFNDNQKKNFLASFMYLKELIQINKNEDVLIPLSEKQEEMLVDLFVLMKNSVETYEKNLDENQDKITVNQKINALKEKFQNNQIINENDYNLIKELIYQYEQNNPDKQYNDVMSYLNDYNLKLLTRKESKPVEVEPPKEEISSDTIEANKTKPNNLNNNVDIFTPQQIEYTKKTSKKSEIKNLNLDELLTSLGINKDNLNTYTKNVLESLELNDKQEKIANYLQNTDQNINPNTFVLIMSLGELSNLKTIFNYFKKINLSKECIDNILNRAPNIFISKADLLIQNIELLLSHEASIETMINNNITFFYNSFEYNKNKINILIDNDLNIKEILNKKPILLAIPTSKLINNLNDLKNYFFDNSNINYDSISIIGVDKLSSILDYFIESNFSSYMFSENSLKKIRSLIIKRLYYAHKNNLSIWLENINDNRINVEYNKYLNNYKSLNETDISSLISSYQELEIIEEGKRISLFDNTFDAQIKRKFELIFNNNIISRIKTYSVLKVLLDNNIELKNALFYALTYNSNITNDDYELIKKEILG